MSLTRGEWVTLFLFVLALALNVAVVVHDKVNDVCGDEVSSGGILQTSCEEDPSTENKYLEPPQK